MTNEEYYKNIEKEIQQINTKLNLLLDKLDIEIPLSKEEKIDKQVLIVSKDKRVPIDARKYNYIFLTKDQFIEGAESKEGLETEAGIFYNIDSLDKIIYDAIKNTSSTDIPIIYYKFNDQRTQLDFVIEEGIKEYNNHNSFEILEKDTQNLKSKKEINELAKHYVENFRWIESKNSDEHLFTFNGYKIFNLFKDYPYNLTKIEKEYFDKKNPYWADFFKDRTKEWIKIEKEVDKKVDKELIDSGDAYYDEDGQIKYKQLFGLVNHKWHIKKAILKTVYNIDWLEPKYRWPYQLKD